MLFFLNGLVYTSKSMKLILSGAAGFIGSNFANNALDSKHEIYILDKLSEGSSISNLNPFFIKEDRLIRFDIAESENYLKLPEDFFNNAIVVNFAAESHVDRSIGNGIPFVLSNTIGAYLLAKHSFSNQAKTFIQISTDEVYGPSENENFSEFSNLNPTSEYAASKAAGELFTQIFSNSYNLDVRTIRASNNFGKNQHFEKFIPLTLLCLLNGYQVPIYGTGNQSREWLPVDSMVDAIWKLIQFGNKGDVYNIGSGLRLTNLELVKIIADKLDLKGNYLKHVEDRIGHDFAYSIDSARAFEKIHWVYDLNFDNYLNDYIKDFKNRKLYSSEKALLYLQKIIERYSLGTRK